MKNVLPRKMEVTIKTLTPLWTGGVDAGKCDRIHETGILGSLRWWMEVLVRGMGGQVKDPTTENPEHRSSLDPKKFDAKIYHQFQTEAERRQYLRNAGLCDVSQIFGATGWKHRFRVEVEDKNTRSAQFQDRYRSLSAREGEFSIRLQSLDPNFNLEIIGGLIQFIADWAALGARPQMGFGVIQVEGSCIDTQPLYDWLITTSGSNICSDLPSLQNIFLAQIQPKDANSSFKEKDTFNLKYDLRQLFRTEGDTTQQQSQGNKPILKKEKEISGDKRKQEEELRHFVMGTVEDDRQAAKIKISRPYDDDKLMRVCGWIPTKSEAYKNDWNREKIVNGIYNHLKGKYTLHDWREMNSERDTVTPNESSTQVFLSSLLKPEK